MAAASAREAGQVAVGSAADGGFGAVAILEESKREIKGYRLGRFQNGVYYSQLTRSWLH